MTKVVTKEVKHSGKKAVFLKEKTCKRGSSAGSSRIGGRSTWKSAEKLEPYLMQAVTALGDPLDTYTEIVTSVCGGTTPMKIILRYHLEPQCLPSSVTRACHSSEGIKVGWTLMEPSLVGSSCCIIWLAHSKSRVGPWGLSEGSGFMVPRVEGNALGQVGPWGLSEGSGFMVPRVEGNALPWGLSEGSGFVIPRVEGNALGWFHRAANTSCS
nr:sister chromatid cohesion protein PDS5-like isoform X1 [Tanacetum cinerariifolium]